MAKSHIQKQEQSRSDGKSGLFFWDWFRIVFSTQRIERESFYSPKLSSYDGGNEHGSHKCPPCFYWPITLETNGLKDQFLAIGILTDFLNMFILMKDVGA